MNTNPWVKFNALSGGTLTAANAVLTAGQVSVFTGINSSPVSALITGEGTFCQGDVVTLSSQVSGGTTPYTYLWSGGLGTGETATPPTAVAGTTTYTLTVRDTNGIVSADTADVVVSTPPSEGTLTGAQAICASTTPGDVTLTGYSGTIVRWERSTNTGFTNPAFIASSSPTLTGAQIGSFTTTRYVRAVIQNGSCPVVYSNYVEITIGASTTWENGAWTNGVPDGAKAVIFNSDYTATGDVNACSVTVNTDADVVVPAGFNLIVNGAVTVNGGTMTVENNANLVQVRNVANSGEISVIKSSSPVYRLDYTLWSSPVAGETLESFSPETLPTRFYRYNPVSNAYNPIAGSTEFANGSSYLIRVSNVHPSFVNTSTPGTPWTGTFNGVPHNGDINVTATPFFDGPGTANDVLGYNSVGNPYPSTINIADFYTVNAANLGSDTSLYFWRKRNDTNANSYASLTLAAYIANGAAGGDASNGLFDNPDESDEWVLNPGQGFIVQASTNTISFTNAMRRTVNNGQFFRTAQNESERSRLWVSLNGTDGLFSQMAVAYTENTTLGIDYGWDGKVLADGDVALYSFAGESMLGIQARPPFDASDVVPAGFRITTAGSYTIALDRFDGVFATGQDIFLRDNLLGVVHNLKTGPYQFTTEAGLFAGRFDIIYAEALGTGPVAENHALFVFKDGQGITVESGTSEIKDITLFDTRGRLLYEAHGINAMKTSITDLQAQEQMLIINITTEKGKTSRKIIY